MSNEKKFLLIIISSIFNFLMILILTFFYFQLQKKSNNLKKNFDDLQKNMEEISDKFTANEYEIHEKKEQILEKLQKEIKQQEDFFKTFEDENDIKKQLEDIIGIIEDVKKTFKTNKQDKKTEDTFKKYRNDFNNISESGVDYNKRTDLKQLVNYMNKFLQMCEERDVRISTLENKAVTDSNSISDLEEKLGILRKYLNGYAFLLDLHLDKVQQITNLIDSLSSKIEKDKLIKLKEIIINKYENFLLKSIQNTAAEAPSFIKELLK
ncbi:hypothetical protein RS022_05600 [Candidatus Phytoplasma rubi]|uniref:Uncharacterized protein n=1 Tax=Candidatus Phytoplasma rubi TaxID=399025 RepID=A0ABY7BSH5_9MOLU|nr:hypothetical protein [Candidatus Phytoplasma rubi]WAN63424.1 hypothetical protein RS022_05600 [Candidatus Phytoplasma rubi]